MADSQTDKKDGLRGIFGLGWSNILIYILLLLAKDLKKIN